MARKMLSVWEINEKQIFDQNIKEYSVKALENIYKIANNAMDARTRLNANIWICEKAVGKDYTLFTEQNNNRDINVSLTIRQGKDVNNEEIVRLIKEVEQEDDDEWDDNKEWGNDIYYG